MLAWTGTAHPLYISSGAALGMRGVSPAFLQVYSDTSDLATLMFLAFSSYRAKKTPLCKDSSCENCLLMVLRLCLLVEMSVSKAQNITGLTEKAHYAKFKVSR